MNPFKAVTNAFNKRKGVKISPITKEEQYIQDVRQEHTREALAQARKSLVAKQFVDEEQSQIDNLSQNPIAEFFFDPQIQMFKKYQKKVANSQVKHARGSELSEMLEKRLRGENPPTPVPDEIRREIMSYL